MCIYMSLFAKVSAPFMHPCYLWFLCGVTDRLKPLVEAIRRRNRNGLRKGRWVLKYSLVLLAVIEKEWFLCCNYTGCCCFADTAICSEKAGLCGHEVCETQTVLYSTYVVDYSPLLHVRTTFGCFYRRA